MTGLLVPEIPASLQEAGLDVTFLEELVLKHQLFLTEFRLPDLAERVKLPISLLEPVLEKHRSEKLVEVKGAGSYAKTSFVFRLTESGRRKAQEALDQSRYSGPAPVSLAAYREMVRKQTVQGAIGGEEALRKALSSLVVNDDVLRRLGVALASGQALFIYGPSGNGKTAIAEAIGRALPGNVYVPYAVQVGGQVIKIYDPACHTLADSSSGHQECDGRWLLVKRPVVNVGGELSLKMLDVSYDPTLKIYEASLQMKANNGLFILDDFGRQQAEPIRLLNRWLVPLERQVDHLTLETTANFPIPFDVQVIFCTDLHPRDLVHEAFLRRLHFKIRIDPTTEEEFLAIFQRACASYGLQYSRVVYDYLNDQWYGSYGVARSACHPKDLISLIVTQSRYYARTPILDLENIGVAAADYFVTL
jgi:energy-coupling factor transporter ATP-binding protein EcfA2